LFSAYPHANRFLSTGREFLKEANLDDYRNRLYSAELVRFPQTDPSASMRGMGICIAMSQTILKMLCLC
jgi:hypothetical protein